MRWRSRSRHRATSRKVACSIALILPGVDSFSKRNEYQGISWEKMWPVRKAENIASFMSRLSGNSWKLKLLEP